MSQIPLPSTSILKCAALLAPAPLRPLTSWLARKLDPLDSLEEHEVSSGGKEDELERKHEEEELALEERRKKERRKEKERVEMSRVVVPVLSHKVAPTRPSRGQRRPPAPVLSKKDERKSKTKDQPQPSKIEKVRQSKPSQPEGERRARNTERERIRVKDHEREGMSVPKAPSPISSFELTGSEFLIPNKPMVSPRSRPRVEREMKEAAECKIFSVWPTFEAPTGGVDQSGIFVGRGVEESGMFIKKEMDDEEKENRMRIEKEWKAKKERSTEGRRRLKGDFGYESVVEREKLRGSEWDFKPTLGSVVERKANETSRDGRTSSTPKATTSKRPVRMFRGDSLAESRRLLSATRAFLADSFVESKTSTTEKEDGDAGGHSERVSGTCGKEENSSESIGPLLNTAAARAMRAFAARDHRQQKARTEREALKGNESAEATEKPQMRPQSKSRKKNKSSTSSSRSPKPKTTYRPWAKHHDAKDDSDDELAFAPKPRSNR